VWRDSIYSFGKLQDGILRLTGAPNSSCWDSSQAVAPLFLEAVMKILNLTNAIRWSRMLILTLALVGLGGGLLAGDRTDAAAVLRARVIYQDPIQAEKYRKLAEAKRREAQRVPEKRECYLAWARYYDCLAEREEAGDNRTCARPPDCG
jgi:hypothetical protein